MLKNLKSLLNKTSLYFNQFQSNTKTKPLKNNILQIIILYQERYKLSRPIFFGTK